MARVSPAIFWRSTPFKFVSWHTNPRGWIRYIRQMFHALAASSPPFAFCECVYTHNEKTLRAQMSANFHLHLIKAWSACMRFIRLGGINKQRKPLARRLDWQVHGPVLLWRDVSGQQKAKKSAACNLSLSCSPLAGWLELLQLSHRDSFCGYLFCWKSYSLAASSFLGFLCMQKAHVHSCVCRQKSRIYVVARGPALEIKRSRFDCLTSFSASEMRKLLWSHLKVYNFYREVQFCEWAMTLWKIILQWLL